MKIVVPLAGPDFERGQVTKAELETPDGPLLKSTIRSRPWFRSAECSASDLIFVLLDRPRSRQFATEALEEWFPESKVVLLPSPTRGAAVSAIAGAIALDDFASEVFCIDLADIGYSSGFSPSTAFASSDLLVGVIPVFDSENPNYSYVTVNDEGLVTQTREKQRISRLASAGTYFYRSAAHFLSAVGNMMSSEDDLTYNGNYFVCPSFNGIINMGEVRITEVTGVVDLRL